MWTCNNFSFFCFKEIKINNYFKEKDGKIYAYAQITLDVAGTTHSENFSFELREDKDSYFVEKMDHTIPADFNKKDDDKGE